MKKIIPFSKEILFKTKIEEITSIALDNTLKLDSNIVSGEFIINGTYKMIENAEVDEIFHYEIPVDITIDNKYDTSNCIISIDDFSYEIINEEYLKVNISVMLDDLDLKVDPIETIEIEVGDREIGLEEKEVDSKVIDNSIENSTINNIQVDVDSKVEFNPKEKSLEEELLKNVNDNPEYSIYRVYTMKEEDTIEKILEQYGISREILADYNDLDNLIVGSKIIIPSVDEWFKRNSK